MSKLFPLVVFFHVKDMTYLFDSRANVLIGISPEEEVCVKKYMKEYEDNIKGGDTSPLNIFSVKAECVLLLQNNGILLPGELEQRVDVGLQNIEDTVRFSEEYVIPRKLTIEVTDRCNLRCKYCTYTINEKNNDTHKKHGKSILSVDDIKKTIYSYSERYKYIYGKIPQGRKSEFLKRNPPAIGWYGGEVLLEFDVVKQTLEYFESLDWASVGIDISVLTYIITTNLTLLTSEMLRYCINHDIYLHISFDGPEGENDKNRVFPNGQGTARIIEEKLELIKSMSKDYFQNKLQIQAVKAPNHDFERVKLFFKNRSERNLYGGVKKLVFLDYKENDSIIPNSTINSQPRHFDEMLFECLKSEDMDLYIDLDPEMQAELKSIMEIMIRLNNQPFTGLLNLSASCYMGFGGLFVSSTGEYHICERSDFTMPIGMMSDGIHTEKLLDLYGKYFDVINSERCRNCWAHRYCKFCAATLMKNGKMKLPSVVECDFHKKVIYDKFENFILIVNYYPEIEDYIVSNYAYKDDITILDYLQ